MNRPTDSCILCYKPTDCYFVNLGYCCWKCKKLILKKTHKQKLDLTIKFKGRSNKK